MKATELGRRCQRPVFAARVTGGKGRGARPGAYLFLTVGGGKITSWARNRRLLPESPRA